MEPSDNENPSDKDEEEEETKQRFSEPIPGPVDPDVLREKLEAIAEEESTVGSSEESLPKVTEQPSVIEGPGRIEPSSTAKSAASPEEVVTVEETPIEDEPPIEILIEQSKKHLAEDSDDEETSEDYYDQREIIYGNVKMQVPGYAILVREQKDRTTFQEDILKTFCVQTEPEISLPKDIRMDVESLYWERSFHCPRCPGEFNCTCNMNVEEIITKLTNCFDLVLLPDKMCTICLQIQDILRQRKVIFCQVNLDDQDIDLVQELKKFLETAGSSSISSQIQHHWDHENQDENHAQVLVLGEKISLPVPDYLDVLIIGTNSAALSMCEEAESCGLNIGIIDITEQDRTSIWGFHRTYTGYGQVLKKYLLEAALVQESLKLASYCGIVGVEGISLDWPILKQNAKKYMNTLAWQRRVNFMNNGVLYIAGSPKLIDRNTVQVSCRQGLLTFHAKYIVYAPESRLVYEHFPGLHRFCYKMHKILYYNTLDCSKTLVYGSTVTALEYGGIFNSLGHDVTIMMNSRISDKYDADMMDELTKHMAKNKIKFVDGCRINTVMPVPRSNSGSASVPNVLEKFMVIAQWVETNKYYRSYFDNVILIPNEEAHFDPSYGLEEIGIRFCRYNSKLIVVDDKYRTSVPNIYAVGSVVPGFHDAAKLFENLGRQLIKSMFTNESINIKLDTKSHVIYTPVEYAFYGLSEKLARASYHNVVVYHSLYEPKELALIPIDFKMPCYIKVICNVEESSEMRRREVILGLHVIGMHAEKIVSGFSSVLSDGMTKENLDDLLGVEFSSAAAVTSVNQVKNIGDSILLPQGCCEK